MKKNMRKILAVCLMFAMVLTAVNVPAATAKKIVVGKSIKLNKKKATIEVGKKLTLKATVKPKKATVTWASSKKKVATVNAKGKVTAKKAGKTNITATITLANGKTKKSTCKVTVKEASTDDAGTTSGSSIGTGDGTGSGTGVDTGTGTGTGTGSDTGTTTVEMTPVPAPAAQTSNAASRELTTSGTASFVMCGATDDDVYAATETTFTQAGAVELTTTATKSGEIKKFKVNTGVPVVSNVYKVTGVTLKYGDKTINNKETKEPNFTVKESYLGGYWEVIFIDETTNNLNGSTSNQIYSGDIVTVTINIETQTPEEAAVNQAKAMKRIPLTAGGTNNVLEATIKLTNVPAQKTYLGISYEMSNSILQADGETYKADQSYLTITDDAVTPTDFYNTTADGKVQEVTKDGEYTFKVEGLSDAVDIKSLEFKTNVPNTNKDFIIQVLSVKVNGQEMVISNTPKGSSTTCRYMCDTGGDKHLEAMIRNCYNYVTDANSPGKYLEWNWVGATEKDFGDGTKVCVDNISRNYFQ